MFASRLAGTNRPRFTVVQAKNIPRKKLSARLVLDKVVDLDLALADDVLRLPSLIGQACCLDCLR